MTVYLLKKALSSYDNAITIEKGKLVMSDGKTTIKTLNGKSVILFDKKAISEYICGTSYGHSDQKISNYIKPCKFTCNDDETLIMELQTNYHTYNAIGRNPHEMYQKIIRMYNSYSGQNYNTGNFHKAHYDYNITLVEEYPIHVHKININMCYWDDESEFRNETDSAYRTSCGNYWNLYVNDCERVFPNKSMK